LILGIALLLIGETSANVDLGFDLGAFDGFWLIFGLPVIAVLVFAVLSPFSFLIHKQWTKRSANGDSAGT